MIRLSDRFLERPITHRGLHDAAQGRIENSPSAIQAAIDAGYGIEIDVQRSADDVAMVFHDYSLQRLTGNIGVVQATQSAELGTTKLVGSTDTVPTLRMVLDMIDGQVPLLIEIKDQDGAMGRNVGVLERAVALDLKDYSGDVAVMSFNPHAIAAFRDHNQSVPVGLVTDPFAAVDWPTIPSDRRAELARIGDLDRLECSFISHNQADLPSDTVAQVKASGRNILCWTVRSQAMEAQARQVADNITFEGYLA